VGSFLPSAPHADGVALGQERPSHAACRVRDHFRGSDAAALDSHSLRLLAGEIDADEAARGGAGDVKGEESAAKSS